jgi:hypothetical protein
MPTFLTGLIVFAVALVLLVLLLRWVFGAPGSRSDPSRARPSSAPAFRATTGGSAMSKTGWSSSILGLTTWTLPTPGSPPPTSMTCALSWRQTWPAFASGSTTSSDGSATPNDQSAAIGS